LGWQTLWSDDSDRLGLGDANQEASVFCTVCELDEREERPEVPLFDSLQAGER
jgi:hypothetical protein